MSTGVLQQARSSSVRVASIDVFRGLTMAVMIFVNELASVRGLPWWNYHAPANLNAITYPDLVFPFFLFAIGLSLPLAFRQRIARGDSLFKLSRHVVERFAALLVLGLILANADLADLHSMKMSGNLWALLALLSAALYLHVRPQRAGSEKLSRALRSAGLLALLLLLALFRSKNGWLDGSYPEILGLIAYSYLACCLLYLPTRKLRLMPALWIAAMLLLSVADAAQWINIHLPLYEWPFSNGSMCALIFAGVCISLLFTEETRPRHPMLVALAFAATCFTLAAALAPLGISKVRATPTWTLASMGASILLFTLLYWICDQQKMLTWSAPIHAAGANTLLTYLLPDLFYFAMGAAGITFFDQNWSAGLAGVAKSLLFTALILALASLLTRARVRLQL